MIVSVVVVSSDIWYNCNTPFFIRTSPGTPVESEQTQIFVQSSYKLNLPPYLIIPSSSIKLTEMIGEGNVCTSTKYFLTMCWSTLGECGIVYKGHTAKSLGQPVDEYFAVKTLKGNRVL